MKHPASPNLTTTCFLLLIWFFIWGICPWNNASAAAESAEAAHADHGRHGNIDDTHHASKGIEHSCSGSISFSENNLKADWTLCASVSGEDVSLSTDPAVSLNQGHGFLKLLFERNTLPKLLTEYYQLYSVYRV